MNRKEFIRNGILATTGLWSGTEMVKASTTSDIKLLTQPFNMKFSPDFGVFNVADNLNILDQIKWGYDQGFRAWENTWLRRRPVEEQEQISRTLSSLGMEFGQFVGTLTMREVTFAGRDQSVRDQVLKEVRESVDIAKRMNTKFVHNVLGSADYSLPWDFQMANAIDLLKRVAEIYEPHGIVMVMETMNQRNHTGKFLHTISQAYAMAKAVASPSVKILFDFYHVQIQEGDLIPTLDYAWDEIAYLQIGDTPGRKEPGTGEINYKNVLQHVYDKGYRGFAGLEHGMSRADHEGNIGALEAYRIVDPI
ncbi:MAG: TIM barrel protein [Cyclobacteriaceae bacterium]